MTITSAIEIALALIVGHLSGRLALRAQESPGGGQEQAPPEDPQRSTDYCWTHGEVEDRGEQ